MSVELDEKAVAKDTAPTDADLDAAANLESDKEPEAIINDEKPPEKLPDEDKGGGEPKEGDKSDSSLVDEDLNRGEDEPTDNTERSRLGRRVAGVEGKIDELVSSLSNFLTAQQRIMESPPKDKNLEHLEDVDDDLPITKKELEGYLNQREQGRRKEATDYLKGYVASVYTHLKGETDKAVADEVLTELDDSAKYPRRTNSPTADSYRNYLEATTAVLRRKTAKGLAKENPLDKNSEKKGEGLKISGEAKMPAAREPVLPELDSAAKDFLKWVGDKGGSIKMSEADIKDALSKPLLTGKKDARSV